MTDYGLDDEFVGVVHRVIERVAPGTRVIDLTHGITAHDVRAGALTLARAAAWLAPAVVLAVVDPGVGTARRPVAVDTAGGCTFVGPDNGLLGPVLERLGPVTASVELAVTRPPDVGVTFDGRDVFAPAAARLAAGAAPGQLGTPIDPAGLATLDIPAPVIDDGRADVEVLWVDRFGNVQLNLTGHQLAAVGARAVVHRGRSRPFRVVTGFGDLAPGELGALVDANAMVALVVDRGSAAAALGVRAGGQLQLRR